MDLQLFTTILTIASAVGAGSSIFLYNRSRSVITLLKDENATLVGINTRQDKQISVLEAEKAAIKNERDIFRDNVTQAPSIEKLAEKTAQQHSEVIGSLGEVVRGLGEVTKALRDVKPSKK